MTAESCHPWLDEVDTDQASRFAAEQAWRFVIAHLNDDEAAVKETNQRIGECPTCLRAVNQYLSSFFAAVMANQVGKDNALAIAGTYLDEVLNAPTLNDLLNPPASGD